MAWEYMIKQFATGDRWESGSLIAEIKRLDDYANKLGADGWEMVGFQPVPTHPVGHVFLVIFKRPTA